MIDIVLKHWKIGAAVIAAVILLFWINSRAQLAEKLWHMVYGDIVKEQKAIEEDLVSEINRLDSEREDLLKKIALLQADREKLKVQNAALDTQKCELEAKLTNLVVPSSVPDVVSGLQQMGLGSARARARNLP